MWANKSNRINGKTVVYKLLVVFSLWLSLVSITNAFFTVPNIPYPFVYMPPSTPALIAAPATINSNPVGSWTVSWSAGAGATTYDYMEAVFTDLPNADTLEDVEALLPWQFKGGLG